MQCSNGYARHETFRNLFYYSRLPDQCGFPDLVIILTSDDNSQALAERGTILPTDVRGNRRITALARAAVRSEILRAEGRGGAISRVGGLK
jgi:hypothetical protein